MYRWIEHTSELELSIEAPAEIAGNAGGGSEEREVVLAAHDRPALLADWLDELVYLADAEGFVPERVGRLELSPGRLHATVLGHLGDPSALVKAVTRHRLAFEPADGGYRARLVLDV